MQAGQNQTIVRDNNLELYFNEFVKGSFSRADIAKKYNISKTASSQIVAELLSLNLIKEIEDTHSKRVTPGARPVLYRFNSGLGLIAIIDMSSPEVAIDICDAGGKVLAQSKIPNMEKIKRRDIEEFCARIKEMLSLEALNGKKLLRVCVALPCAVDNISQKVYWSPRFDINQVTMDLEALLEKKLGVKAILVNDVSLLLRGEIRAGLITEKTDYALYIYVDSGIGGALYVNGKHERGRHGLAGEMGYFPIVKPSGHIAFLDEVASINGMKSEIKFQMLLGAQSVLSEHSEHLKFVNIEAAYKVGDPLTKRVVEKSAEAFAGALKSIVKITDIPFVVISGRITRLGDTYLEIIKKTLKTDMLFPVRVEYSSLNDGINKGAIATALEQIVEEKIKNR